MMPGRSVHHAVGGFENSSQHVEKSCFAAAVRSDESEHFPGAIVSEQERDNRRASMHADVRQSNEGRPRDEVIGLQC